VEAEEENGADGPVFSRYRRSEWQLIVWDDHPIVCRGLPSFSCSVLEMRCVDGENDVAHFVDELEDGERCFG
jgi:hypothetical protein